MFGDPQVTEVGAIRSCAVVLHWGNLLCWVSKEEALLDLHTWVGSHKRHRISHKSMLGVWPEVKFPTLRPEAKALLQALGKLDQPGEDTGCGFAEPLLG